ncbi:DUF3231 family protein [Desulfitibacter alkalitolerans]|uniref:DUF3231 family protein n=1 Tax=Desulfitibacter alkalitolerans TaxID=264641 RepID=UPI000481131F|nr:DUF3231 family protein [Desulfitibacter alkalitolerans]
MVLNIGAKKDARQAQLNVEEAYVLWDMTNVTYAGIDMAQIWGVYVHDPDLNIILQRAIDKYKKRSKDLEKELRKYSIDGPTQPRADKLAVATNSELLTDENIGKYLLLFLQEQVELLFKSIRNSTTNDAIRAMFIKFLTDIIGDLDILIKYLKLKGWIGIPPIYPNIPVSQREKADTGEIFHLWDHLTFRYDNIYQTQYWVQHTNDSDFKTLLKKGLQDTLKIQVKKLEQELIKFGVPLPQRPPAVIASTGTTNMEDSYMFRILFTGMIGAAWMHALALKQCFTNDRLRDIFKDLLVQEINIIDKMILFGKTKGWLGIVPQYSPKL